MQKWAWTMGAAIGICSAVGAVRAAIINPGTYTLHNHPNGGKTPPEYGLRLDELFDVTRRTDVWTFDFDERRSRMFLDYDGANTVRIRGRAIGGLDVGSEYDQSTLGKARIRLRYHVEPVPGDDDLFVPTANMALATGKVKWMKTGEVFYLTAKDKDGFAFRFGDEDDNQGHRRAIGLSGWGWLLIGGEDRRGAQDLNFSATLIPLPAPVMLGGVGMLAVMVVRQRLKKLGRTAA